jgi:putative flippase GtrA
VATIIGIAIATIFRLYCYRRFVFREQRTDDDGTAEQLASTSSSAR